MNAPTYILKRVYLERNQEREHLNHEKRLKSIASSKEQTIKDVKRKAQQVIQQQELSKKNHERATNFQKSTHLRELHVQDRYLIEKIMEAQQRPIAQDHPGQANVSFQKPMKSLSVSGLHAVGRKKEEERIMMENMSLFNRMNKLPPVISQKKLETEYQKNKEIGTKILRFHNLKKKKDLELEPLERKTQLLQQEEVDEELDPNNEQLMNERVQLVIAFTKIEFINFLPLNKENEKYYLSIKSSVREPRKTTLELYNDFSKTVVNEFFYVHELRKSKLMYIGLYQVKENNEIFLGDFEVNLTPYYKEGVQKSLSLDLRNFALLKTRPSYIPTDMRKKGVIEFDLKITSNVKKYLLDSNDIRTELAPEMEKTSKDKQKEAANSNEKKD